MSRLRTRRILSISAANWVSPRLRLARPVAGAAPAAVLPLLLPALLPPPAASAAPASAPAAWAADAVAAAAKPLEAACQTGQLKRA